MEKTVTELTQEKSVLDAELAEARRELAEIEGRGTTSGAALASHGKAKSRVAILDRRRQEIEGEIRDARRATAQAEVDRLQAQYVAAVKRREAVKAELGEKFAGLYDYPGGAGILRIAVSGAQPLRSEIFAAMALDEQLRRARATLHDMA